MVYYWESWQPCLITTRIANSVEGSGYWYVLRFGDTIVWDGVGDIIAHGGDNHILVPKPNCFRWFEAAQFSFLSTTLLHTTASVLSFRSFPVQVSHYSVHYSASSVAKMPVRTDTTSSLASLSVPKGTGSMTDKTSILKVPAHPYNTGSSSNNTIPSYLYLELKNLVETNLELQEVQAMYQISGEKGPIHK